MLPAYYSRPAMTRRTYGPYTVANWVPFSWIFDLPGLEYFCILLRGTAAFDGRITFTLLLDDGTWANAQYLAGDPSVGWFIEFDSRQYHEAENGLDTAGYAFAMGGVTVAAPVKPYRIRAQQAAAPTGGQGTITVTSA